LVAERPTECERRGYVEQVRAERALSNLRKLKPESYVEAYTSVQRGYGFLPQIEIDDFRETVRRPLNERRKRLLAEMPEDLETGPSEYFARKEWVRAIAGSERGVEEVDQIVRLVDELVILAIYKAVEIHRSSLLTSLFSSAGGLKLSDVRYLRATFPFACKAFAADIIEELRLLCNCIKHSGRVSQALSRQNPVWLAGEPLANLDLAYDRIAPYVGAYWISLLQLAHEEAPDGARW
jgi:hypothetical protein